MRRARSSVGTTRIALGVEVPLPLSHIYELSFIALLVSALASPAFGQEDEVAPGVAPPVEAEVLPELEVVGGSAGAFDLRFVGVSGQLSDEVSWRLGAQSRQPRLDFPSPGDFTTLPQDDRGWAEMNLESMLSIEGIHEISRSLEFRWQLAGYGDDAGGAAIASTALVWWFTRNVGISFGVTGRTPGSDRFTTWDQGQAWTEEERVIRHMEAQMRGDNPYSADAGEAIGELIGWGLGIVTRTED